MNPQITQFAFADAALKEEGTNKHSVIGIFQFWNPKKIPFVLPRFVVYARLINVPLGTKEIKVTLSTHGEEIGEVVFSNLSTTDTEINVHAYFNKISVERTGKIYADIYVGNEKLERLPEQFFTVKDIDNG